MRISSINSAMSVRKANFSAKAENTTLTKDIYTGEKNERLLLLGRAADHFTVVENISNPKVGSKFILEPKSQKYQGLRILVGPDTTIEGKDMFIGVKQFANASFKGRLYGSIRDTGDSVDSRMQTEYMRFWTTGMKQMIDNYPDKKYAPKLKDDYNFYIPTDGDGTRYKDITTLQGGVTKPASYIPAVIYGSQMSLVQGVIANFAKTGKLDKMYDFINVKPAKGSAYGFLEGLRTGKIPTDKPLVFSWGDNFSDINISRLMKNHEDKNSGFTVTVLPVHKYRTMALSVIKTDDVESRKIDKFVEKPQDMEFIDSCVLPQFGENRCLSSVGPYILSKQALTWIKDKYTEDPKSFLNPDKGYDFSSMIISPMLEAFNKGEILDDNGTPMEMKFDLIAKDETWSDLGSQTDFSAAMKEIAKGGYKYLPQVMSYTMKSNVDKKDNITFNPKTREMFDSMLKDINATATNAIAYCKE